MKHIPIVASHNNGKRNKFTSYLPINDKNDTKQKPHGFPRGLAPRRLRHPVVTLIYKKVSEAKQAVYDVRKNICMFDSLILVFVSDLGLVSKILKLRISPVFYNGRFCVLISNII